ncbi:RHS repeat domain-containing protein [Pseudoalteromonas denitrificans]|uniref:RHS repeat-associated core domain-containing protein n=1 Tax=Pseudoalteromonas denitrificans DSM 6059 TaxID=1123010 RepID=A0A1I1LZR0_9GAMM|nr:RHS repeat-associated core domain-containing protein [Pseudoalteromonas denitrificans]SFC76438.1 RHS repeat-associated core domain-containing protein [Pseudoalteromonas denitrificans DSM 6059]
MAMLNQISGYTKIGNINKITDVLDNQQNETYQYDVVSRLIKAQGQYGNLKYTYDVIGNRLEKNINETPDIYQYSKGVLMQTSNKTISYDASGNMLHRGNDVYTYNQAGRLNTAKLTSGEYLYRYNYLGQRVSKQNTEHNLIINQNYHYGLNGLVLAESDGTGHYTTEYVYLNGQRLALFINEKKLTPLTELQTSASSKVYYLHTNHLDAPLALTNQAGEQVWQAQTLPFGSMNILIDKISGQQINQRFPGQYHDVESGLYYNYFRDYDPELGRYIQSDPIGLAGGINTYGYVGGNPITRFDPDGLEIRVYSSDAWGVSGLNHSYVYSTGMGLGRGANGSSGWTLGDGVGGLNNPYLVIPLPLGMTEEEFMDKINSADNWNNGLYFPFVNDCHNDLERAFDHVGIDYPGAPNERFDVDDNFIEYLRRIHNDAIRRLFNPLKLRSNP